MDIWTHITDDNKKNINLLLLKPTVKPKKIKKIRKTLKRTKEYLKNWQKSYYAKNKERIAKRQKIYYHRNKN
tara:strand:+ start:1276 stop:1491 length:216 start_codon:yes stop_codon:yes gene_type:complete